jgi:hypothetical protein
MGLAICPVCASCQYEKETALHFVCGRPTLATLRTRIFGKPIMYASEFAEFPASAILWFAFQCRRCKNVRQLLMYDSSINFLFVFFFKFIFILSCYFLFLFSLLTLGSTLGSNRGPRAIVLLLSGVAPPFFINPSILVAVFPANAKYNSLYSKYKFLTQNANYLDQEFLKPFYFHFEKKPDPIIFLSTHITVSQRM